MVFRSGRARQRLTLQKPSDSQNAITGEVDPLDETSWTNVERPWAIVRPLTGDELVRAQVIHAHAKYEVTLRYSGELFENRRLLIPELSTELNAGLTDTTGTSVTVSTAFPRPDARDYPALIDSELLTVTSGHNSTGLTVTRGAYGSTAATHTSGADVITLGALYIKSVLPVSNKRAEVKVLAGEIK
jgi:head-tail adaptor